MKTTALPFTRRRLLQAALALPATPVLAQTPAASAAKPGPGGYTEIRWDDLVPKGWDPMKGVRDRNLNLLNDADPKTAELLRQLREAWDNAPTEPRLDGALVRLPGYLVPLDETKAGLSEFLLVPYFGACIHTPPPPANQIVLVQPAKPVAGYKAMDTVWVNGRLQVARQGSPMGTSAYRIEAAQVERYKAPAR